MIFTAALICRGIEDDSFSPKTLLLLFASAVSDEMMLGAGDGLVAMGAKEKTVDPQTPTLYTRATLQQKRLRNVYTCGDGSDRKKEWVRGEGAGFLFIYNNSTHVCCTRSMLFEPMAFAPSVKI